MGDPKSCRIPLNFTVNQETYKWIEKTRDEIPRSTFVRSIILAYREGHLKGEVKMDIRPYWPGRKKKLHR